jgi:hypothetical protein
MREYDNFLCARSPSAGPTYRHYIMNAGIRGFFLAIHDWGSYIHISYKLLPDCTYITDIYVKLYT